MYEKAAALQRELVADWKAQSPNDDDNDNEDYFAAHLIFQSLPTVFSRHSEARGGNVLGLDRETTNGVLCQAQFVFAGDAERERDARARMTAFRTALKRHSDALGAAVDWEYLNYADGLTQDPLRTYGADNVEHLRRVAAKYDPEGVFQTRMPGGFKISKVQG